MTDKAREAITRGVKAKSLLENDLLNKWWADVDVHLNIQMRQTELTNTPRMIEIKALMDSVTKMRKDFNRYVVAGENAKTRLGDVSLKEKILRKVA